MKLNIDYENKRIEIEGDWEAQDLVDRVDEVTKGDKGWTISQKPNQVTYVPYTPPHIPPCDSYPTYPYSPTYPNPPIYPFTTWQITCTDGSL